MVFLGIVFKTRLKYSKELLFKGSYGLKRVALLENPFEACRSVLALH